MPKMKTHKGLKKRVKVTASGKFLRKKANKSHLMSSKNSNRRRRLAQGGQIAASDVKRVKRLLGMG